MATTVTFSISAATSEREEKGEEGLIVIDVGALVDRSVIAITGGTGTLGQALVAEILEKRISMPRKILN